MTKAGRHRPVHQVGHHAADARLLGLQLLGAALRVDVAEQRRGSCRCRVFESLPCGEFGFGSFTEK